MRSISGFVSLMLSRRTRIYYHTWLIRPTDLSVVLGVNTIFVSRTDMLLSLSLSLSLLRSSSSPSLFLFFLLSPLSIISFGEHIFQRQIRARACNVVVASLAAALTFLVNCSQNTAVSSTNLNRKNKDVFFNVHQTILWEGRKRSRKERMSEYFVVVYNCAIAYRCGMCCRGFVQYASCNRRCAFISNSRRVYSSIFIPGASWCPV